jgi:ferredoxin--NADP+ reductase
LFPITYKQQIAPAIKLIKVRAPEIAAKAQPGQFIIYRIDEKGERVPLTIADTDVLAGTLTLIFQEVGRSTLDLGKLETGDSILDLVGPLGMPSEIEPFGTVVCVGGGVGIAPLYPIARALQAAGNHIITILGGRSGEYLILEPEMRQISDQLILVTDDGSVGAKGFVTTALQELMAAGTPVDRVVAIGPVPMMAAVANMTRPYGIKTMVSMNTIMVDGTGMCGACRFQVGNTARFACVDGPDFDGHQIDWDIAKIRTRLFLREEKIALEYRQDREGDCRCQN